MEVTKEFLTIIPSDVIGPNVNSYEEVGGKFKEEIVSNFSQSRKERKGGSYVWNYCDKLSRHKILCKLCKKLMSFHGTANVITHLQRRHNILGREEQDVPTFDVADEDDFLNIAKDDARLKERRRRRTAAATSIVWKYCTRLSEDMVRCSICKKDLSFQGTSNLQRHLHRMHGIATKARPMHKLDQEDTVEIEYDFIWEYFEHIDNKIKCTMCARIFDEKQSDEIRNHLRETHAIRSQPPAKSRKLEDRNMSSEETEEGTDDYDADETSQGGNTQYTLDIDIKPDAPAYEDIIEEDYNAVQTNDDEDPFDPSMMKVYTEAKPLSPATSRETSPDPTSKTFIKTNKLRKLNQELLRVEAEYFREKAGYYRMQKYLIALQAKKARIELDQLQRVDSAGVYDSNIHIADTHPSTTIFIDNQKK